MKRQSAIGELADMIKATALLIVVSVVAYGGCSMMPTAEPEPTMSLIDVETEIFWAEFWQWLWMATAVFVGIVVVAVSIIKINQMRIQARYIRPDRNGSMPILPYTYNAIGDDGHMHKFAGYIDLQKMPDPGVQLHMNGSVKASTFGGTDPATQADLARQANIQRHKAAQNRIPQIGQSTRPTVAQMRAESGVYDAERRAKDARARILEERAMQITERQRVQSIVEPAPELYPIPALEKALEASDEQSWIMGANGQRQTAIFRPKTDGHMAIFGSNGSGKTKSSAMMAALYALKFGWNVIALDGKGGVDWMRYSNSRAMHAHVLTGDNIGYFMERINAEMSSRLAKLTQLNYESLHEAHANGAMRETPKTLIILEELGANILASPKPAETARQLGALIRRLRASGIHLVLVEQSPDKNMLTNGIKANAVYFVYQLPGHQHQVVNATAGVKSLEPGQFECHAETFQAWNVYESRLLSSHTIQWPDLFGIAPSDRINQIAADSGDISDPLQRAIQYRISNPNASHGEVADACRVSRATSQKAARILSDQ